MMKWIVIEGLDGVGKSSVIKQLQQILKATQTPLPNPVLRNYFDSQPNPVLRRSFYFMENNLTRLHAETILERGGHAITDRYMASTIAYMNSFDKEIDSDMVNVFLKENINATKPDLTVYLMASRMERIRRIAERHVAETNEEILLKENDAQERCHQEYLNTDMIDCILDTTMKTPAEIAKEIEALVVGSQLV
jgi:dTMP kinase